MSGVGGRTFPESDPGASGLHAQWYDANCAAGALTAQQCACGVWRAPARYRCAVCGGEAWEFRPVTPTPRVESWTITRRPVHFGFAEAVPYALLVVVTTEGARFLLQYRDDPEAVGIGDTVATAVDRYGVPYAMGSA